MEEQCLAERAPVSVSSFGIHFYTNWIVTQLDFEGCVSFIGEARTCLHLTLSMRAIPARAGRNNQLSCSYPGASTLGLFVVRLREVCGISMSVFRALVLGDSLNLTALSRSIDMNERASECELDSRLRAY